MKTKCKYIKVYPINNRDDNGYKYAKYDCVDEDGSIISSNLCDCGWTTSKHIQFDFETEEELGIVFWSTDSEKPYLEVEQTYSLKLTTCK